MHTVQHSFSSVSLQSVIYDVRGKGPGRHYQPERIQLEATLLHILPADDGEAKNGRRGGSGRKRSKRSQRRKWLTEVVVVGAYITPNKGQRAAEISHLSHRRHRQSPPPRRRPRHARV